MRASEQYKTIKWPSNLETVKTRQTSSPIFAFSFYFINLKALHHASSFYLFTVGLSVVQLMWCEEICFSKLLRTSLNWKVLNFKNVTITNVCNFCQITNSKILQIICLSLMIFLGSCRFSMWNLIQFCPSETRFEFDLSDGLL